MVTLTINGDLQTYAGDPTMPLLWYLRDEVALTGTKFGCGAALCGACTVHVDGVAARSCVTPMGTLDGKAVVTIEGLSESGTHPLQIAWNEQRVPQCGFCQGGQIMQAASLLAGNPEPSDAEIVRAMQGNICRCGTYTRIQAAIKSVRDGS
ncbi:MAG: (2Fe-2S)-binding protein [Pseudomonadota bacterium]